MPTGVPYFPQIVPENTVLGRTAAGNGPVEAIPFATLLALLIAGAPRIITAAGGVVVNPGDSLIVLKKVSPSSTAVTLPSVFAQGGIILEVFDWNGNAGDITFVPDGSELINGVSSWTVQSGGAVGTGGKIRLIPSTDLDGWLV